MTGSMSLRTVVVAAAADTYQPRLAPVCHSFTIGYNQLAPADVYANQSLISNRLATTRLTFRRFVLIRGCFAAWFCSSYSQRHSSAAPQPYKCRCIYVNTTKAPTDVGSAGVILVPGQSWLALAIRAGQLDILISSVTFTMSYSAPTYLLHVIFSLQLI